MDEAWRTLLNNEALWGALIGGVLTALGTLIAGLLLDKRARAYAARSQRLTAAQEVLGALQELNRRLIDVARVDSSNHADMPWPELHLATIRWNSARLNATLVAPADEVDLLQQIDQETDQLMDLALGERWTSRAFRVHREPLGSLGATYLNLVRKNEKLQPSQIDTIWPWAEVGDPIIAAEPREEAVNAEVQRASGPTVAGR